MDLVFGQKSSTLINDRFDAFVQLIRNKEKVVLKTIFVLVSELLQFSSINFVLGQFKSELMPGEQSV